MAKLTTKGARGNIQHHLSGGIPKTPPGEPLLVLSCTGRQRPFAATAKGSLVEAEPFSCRPRH
jgi:hypothetical protein